MEIYIFIGTSLAIILTLIAIWEDWKMFKWIQNGVLMDAITLNLFRAYLITSILVGFITVIYFTYKHVKNVREHAVIKECLRRINEDDNRE